MPSSTDSNSPVTWDVLIIGAGLAGLSAANDLHQAGLKVLVVDKGRGLGGRLAGRRIGDATFDHGAQFMTARDSRFKASVAEWIEAGVAEEWYSSYPRTSQWSSAISRRAHYDCSGQIFGDGYECAAHHQSRQHQLMKVQDNQLWSAALDNGDTIKCQSAVNYLAGATDHRPARLGQYRSASGQAGAPRSH